MHASSKCKLSVLLASVLLFALTPVSSAATVFDEPFDSLELGTVWKEHGMGAPNIALSVIAAHDSQVLMMQSNGEDEEFYGIETIDAISLANVSSLTMTTRIRPINMGVQGTRSAAEVALLGSSGEIVRTFTSNNAGPDPESINDWANHYEDSLENIADSPPWPHCDVACDAIRNFVLTITETGTTLTTFDDSHSEEAPNWQTTIDGFKLSNLGTSFKIAARQGTVSGGDDAMGFFDFIHVETTQTAGLVGDFNANGQLDLADIDLLTSASASNANEARFDLNADQAVNFADIQNWVVTIKDSWIGDANLDGKFDSGDFVDVFQKGKYEAGSAAVWSEGDWNGDGFFTSGDFVVAFQDGGYEGGVRFATAAVPEPSNVLALAVFLPMMWRSRHRRIR